MRGQVFFHAFVMKSMFFYKRARQDILPGIAFLAIGTSEHSKGNLAKLIKTLTFLNETKTKSLR